ncbi:MAG: hypothetical protein PVG86_01580 [Desulfobacterales bacterium]|jgi:hypothetical protein
MNLNAVTSGGIFDPLRSRFAGFPFHSSNLLHIPTKANEICRHPDTEVMLTIVNRMTHTAWP